MGLTAQRRSAPHLGVRSCPPTTVHGTDPPATDRPAPSPAGLAMNQPPMGLWRRAWWSLYAIGTGIGLLSWATFLFIDKSPGTSTLLVGAAGTALCTAEAEHVAERMHYPKEYGTKVGGFKPVFDWQMSLHLTLIAGAFSEVRLSRSLRSEAVPGLWAARFGASRVKRLLAALAGGFILLFGARMAGGCTSGYGISGGLQLAVWNWIFFVTTFISGIATAFALFGRVPASAPSTDNRLES